MEGLTNDPTEVRASIRIPEGIITQRLRAVEAAFSIANGWCGTCNRFGAETGLSVVLIAESGAAYLYPMYVSDAGAPVFDSQSQARVLGRAQIIARGGLVRNDVLCGHCGSEYPLNEATKITSRVGAWLNELGWGVKTPQPLG